MTQDVKPQEAAEDKVEAELQPEQAAEPGFDDESPTDQQLQPELDELGKLQAALSDKDDQLKRLAAEFDNFRKRSRREVADALVRGQEQAIHQLLPVVDNLQRAAEAAEQATDVESLRTGVQMVLKLFEESGEKLDLHRVETLHRPFDPSSQDAIQQVETEEVPPGTVMHEVVPGYRIGQKLIRPASVIVAKAPKPPAAEPA